ncbi:MAG: hypothetical protein LBJ04_22960 [Sphingobacterium sp.]|jgi:hypothetical protein|nr:hypothetical protein [Sphingobacterium sp.]
MGWLESMVRESNYSLPTILRRITFLWGIVPFIFFGCKRDSPEITGQQVAKTVLVYISANNDLKYSALKSIDQMESSYLPKYGNLLVFIKTDRYSSHILRIKSDKEIGMIKSDTLISYGYQNASDPTFMKSVMEDMKKLSPSDEYALVMWSHGTAWLPNLEALRMSIGYDRGVETNISDLKNVIPDNLSYLLFDACYMSSIEVIYELKDKADYIIASKAEVLNTSFPYDKIVPFLFGNVNDLKEICREYYEFYNNKEGLERSCTVSLVDTKELDNLALESGRIIRRHNDLEIDRAVQDFNFLKEIPIEFFDFKNLFEKNFPKEETKELTEILDRCILFKAATPNFLNNPIKDFSGLSISVPVDPKFRSFYKTLSWYQKANVAFF